MDQFLSFLLVLCPICFFTGITNATLALTHWQIFVPLSISIWKYEMEEVIFLSVALDFFSSALSILLLRNLFLKKGIKLIIPKFVNLFGIVATISSIVGWLIREYTLEYLSMVLGTGVSWALLLFFFVFVMKSLKERKIMKEKKALLAQKKATKVPGICSSADTEKMKLKNNRFYEIGDIPLQCVDNVETKTVTSGSEITNSSNRIENSNLMKEQDLESQSQSKSQNQNQNQNQKKVKLEAELKPWAGDFKNKQFKITFILFVIFLIPTFMGGAVIGIGPGLFLGVLFSKLFGFGPLNSSVVANFLMELQMIVMTIGYLGENNNDYSFLLPRFLILLPFSLGGVIVGCLYSVKISKLKVFILNSTIFAIGFTISVIVYLLPND
ncbi:protein yippee-like [Anaeramoeba flamelloides]|uniref:Protein yippee-like n=1 Tax=Anaeramoeba flamelloides TaxID=1746091 RepID=A0ABQ8YN91_9EUKA|nr:protein yippee-like [Anaeramoeba flamelloides]